MGVFEKFDEEEYKTETLAEVRAEMAQNNHRSLEDSRVVEFVSRSNGRWKKLRRFPREVSLFIYGKVAYPIIGGEIRRRKSGGLAPDIVANEALEFLPPDERSTDKLLELVRIRQKTPC